MTWVVVGTLLWIVSLDVAYIVGKRRAYGDAIRMLEDSGLGKAKGGKE